MSKIIFSKPFLKSYAARVRPKPKLSLKFDQRYKIFQQGERGYPLDDHLFGYWYPQPGL